MQRLPVSLGPACRKSNHDPTFKSSSGIDVYVPEGRMVDHRASAPFPLCFTEVALNHFIETVGARRPETGGMGFGPIGRMGIDHFEFDRRGSSNASSAVYSPDEVWGAERQDYWMSRPEGEQKLWSSGLHSHPGGLFPTHPSSRAGEGLGDLGYAREVFACNESMQYFLMPILTNTGSFDKQVMLAPWVVCRDNPDRAMLAEVKVCASASEFPERVFNPEFEERLQAASQEQPEPERKVGENHPLRVEHLRDLVGVDVARVAVPGDAAGLALVLALDGITITLTLGREFPAAAPVVSLKGEMGVTHSYPFRWSTTSSRSAEARLARLCDGLLDWMARAF